jgi:hypothetical protein
LTPGGTGPSGDLPIDGLRLKHKPLAIYDLPMTPLAQQLHGFDLVRCRAALHADLYDPAVLARRLDHLPAPKDVVAGGL